jgi:hypothetical protein
MEFGTIMRKPRKRSAAFLSALLLASNVWPTSVIAAPPERPTLNHTEDPRPNILPDWIYNHHVPYRQRYNRPTYHGGKIAYHISPTSQEAMAWEENLERGKYDGHHCPPLVKGYFYPKPWEMLNTGPRPNFATQTTANRSVLESSGPVPGSSINRLQSPGIPGAPQVSESIDAGRSSRPNATAPEPELREPSVIPQK